MGVHMGSMIKNDLEKTLGLLNFALQKEGVIRGRQGRYEIFRAGDSVGGDGIMALIELPRGEWRVASIERGDVSSIAIFDRYEQATNYFFSILMGGPRMWSYLSEWQEETGLEF